MEQRIGFVGLGRMGSRMAERLLDHGYALIVHDVNPTATDAFSERGVPVASWVAELAQDTSVVLASLPTPSTVESVALGPDGLGDGLGSGATFIDLSTTGIEVEQKVAQGLAERGIEVLDAPVSGGVKGARDGTLAVMVAGKPEVFERYADLLRVIGRVFYVSDHPGLGQAMKLVNNLLSATAMAASCEAIVLATKVGLEPRMVVDVINAGSGRNSATLDKFPRSILPRTFDYGFATELMCKDLDLVDAVAKQHSYPLFIGHTVRDVWELLLAKGFAKEDFTNLVKIFEEIAGVEVVGEVGA